MLFTPEENRARQEALYDFLLARGDKWTSMEQTTDSIPMYPTYTRSTYHNSTARRLLTKDIEAVNSSDSFDKIIVSGNMGIKLANENDFEKFLKTEFCEIFRKLKRVLWIAKKGSRDQQIDLEGKVRDAFLAECLMEGSEEDEHCSPE